MDDPCPFCHIDPARILADGPLYVVIRDGFPISRGHTLIIPKRHVASVFECTEAERTALLSALDVARKDLDQTLSPDGYNIGINDGPAAGQTVGHLHIHLIPRYAGDQPDPRGGVRWIFPEKARYWSD
jgi:diadenosine tetraphosphate (Ap4A) HIT family hydrolase